MHTRHTAAALILAATLLLAGCSNDPKPDPAGTTTPPAAATTAAPPAGSAAAACRAAIKAQYEPGTVNLTGAPTRPPACQGLTSDQVTEIAQAVIEEQLAG
ncbi:hypothetical protein QMK19_34240 [Streptomyces sp. H10-C2]|uniref:hypothetical protein n=1 Tax=unclassified Streptomyces TaxID=2593676 RepID=UPI0024BBE2D3|nr:MULTISPECIES: hypothetical protein [unclassified Streptomyces]MDJ0345697.1 hypothetical protein [Streptomyces sp. PH10-H1]MDJ0374549.1 hypothetical protein [Streptomyces sp. H10-C2]